MKIADASLINCATARIMAFVT